MKVVLVSGIWPPDVGGPASHGPGFGRYLVGRGHDVHAVITADRPSAENPGFPLTIARRDRPRLIRHPAAGLAVLKAAGGADVVYATGLDGRSAVASKLRRVPLVLKLVNDPAYERARRLGLFSGSLEEFQQAQRHPGVRWLKQLRTRTVSRASRVVIPSRYLAEIARGWEIPAERISVVPNPAPPVDRSTPRGELRRRFGIKSPTFVFAGRLVTQKNLPLAIAAVGKVAEASLVLVGDGPLRDEVMGTIAERGLADRVRMTGGVPRAEVIDWLRAADAALLASDWENYPHAAVEALAAGTPVIATSVGGVPEIVESGVNGILSPPGDVASLAEAIGSVVKDPVLLERLRAGAAANRSTYSENATFEALERTLELAVGQP